ncbi:hypothetical protein [Paenibacillus lutrae]|uniref:Uncharacterized protein n=1 Tax=Paenibacillus lutrae TaxID=2078573 RepID=A0A7X3FM37_9BACL|nr:hypothetical protein [Paenibacillus lutrae]MVP02142.1 hypothetical protein [Paenibacillus lutrae]
MNFFSTEMRIFEQKLRDLLAIGDGDLRALQNYSHQVEEDVRRMLEYFYGKEEDPTLSDLVDGVEWYFERTAKKYYATSPICSLVHLLRLGYRADKLHNLITLHEAAEIEGKGYNAVYSDIRKGLRTGYLIFGMNFVDRSESMERQRKNKDK